MADAAATEKPAKPPKAKRNILGILMPVLAFVAGAGAGGAGAGLAIIKFMPGAGGDHGKAEAQAHDPVPAGPLEYVEIDNAFTSNLADSGRYLQVKLSLSTFGGPDAIKAVEKHKPALVSAVLAALGETTDKDIETAAAKDALRGRLKDVLNTALKGKGEAGLVEEVFFTSLVVQ
jgi:flagellar FliL protein